MIHEFDKVKNNILIIKIRRLLFYL